MQNAKMLNPASVAIRNALAMTRQINAGPWLMPGAGFVTPPSDEHAGCPPCPRGCGHRTWLSPKTGKMRCRDCGADVPETKPTPIEED